MSVMVFGYIAVGRRAWSPQESTLYMPDKPVDPEGDMFESERILVVVVDRASRPI